MYLGAEEKVAPGKNPAKKSPTRRGAAIFSPPPAGTFATLLDGPDPGCSRVYGPGLFLGMVALMKSV